MGYFLHFSSLYHAPYRGSLPYATFGSGENSHKPKIALGKYLANAIFGWFYSITAILIIRSNAYKITQKSH